MGVASALAPGLVCVRGGVCGGARADMLELLLEVLMNVAIIREYFKQTLAKLGRKDGMGAKLDVN